MTRKRRTQRLRRVDETLRQVISESLLANRDRHLEGIVVTGVETSSDTAYADVFVQVPGNEARRERGLAALERVRPSIQARINDEMRLRLTPVLRFRRDETLEHSIRIEQLLAEHRPLDPPPATEEAPPGDPE
jgi:ribosome-binding factor A